jgi:Trypsin-like peptidase domain
MRTNDLVPLPFGHPSLFPVLALVTGDGEQRHIAGTATMIRPGLALTALHVVMQPLKLYRGVILDLGRDHDVSFDISMTAFQPHADGTYAAWRIEKACSSRHSDLAWLQMDTAPRVGVPSQSEEDVTLALVPPSKDTRIVAFGYRGGRATFTGSHIEVATQPLRVSGRVVDVFPEYRDRGNLTYPCFQTNARFDDGMSGGPVFDEAGRLRGVVSYGLDAEDELQEPVSYAALLWPSLATTLERSPFQGKRVYDLAAASEIDAEEWERFSFGEERRVYFDPTGLQCAMAWPPRT